MTTYKDTVVERATTVYIWPAERGGDFFFQRFIALLLVFWKHLNDMLYM